MRTGWLAAAIVGVAILGRCAGPVVIISPSNTSVMGGVHVGFPGRGGVTLTPSPERSPTPPPEPTPTPTPLPTPAIPDVVPEALLR